MTRPQLNKRHAGLGTQGRVRLEYSDGDKEVRVYPTMQREPPGTYPSHPSPPPSAWIWCSAIRAVATTLDKTRVRSLSRRAPRPMGRTSHASAFNLTLGSGLIDRAFAPIHKRPFNQFTPSVQPCLRMIVAFRNVRLIRPSYGTCRERPRDNMRKCRPKRARALTGVGFGKRPPVSVALCLISLPSSRFLYGLGPS
jgi:hypothetical protein